MASFKDAGGGLTFLESEREESETFGSRQADLSDQARAVLQERGAYVLSIDGYYGGTDGVYGSADLGVRIIQGTEPAYVNKGSCVALRQGPRERDGNTYLVNTNRKSGAYMRELGGVLAVFAGTKVILPYVERVSEDHLEAVSLLVNMMELDLLPLKNPPLKLPREETVYTKDFKDGKVINLRTTERTDVPDAVYW